MRQCIYCLRAKAVGEFNTEHVIPQAFGRFKSNLTLHCVCAACNSYFANTLDLRLGRDTIEGHERLKQGLKRPDEWRNRGKNATVRTTFVEGPYAGAHARISRDPQTKAVVVYAEPQFGIATNSEGPYEYFWPNDLPPKAAMLRRHPGAAGLYVRIAEMSREQAEPFLKAKGYTVESWGEPFWPAPHEVATELVGRIDHEVMRGMAKIAMNYLANQLGPQAAIMSQFDGVRRYVRFGDHDRQFVRVDKRPIINGETESRRLEGHTIMLLWKHTEQVLASVVSLSNILRYEVQLSTAAFRVQPQVHSGHFFSLGDDRGIYPLRIGRQTLP